MIYRHYGIIGLGPVGAIFAVRLKEAGFPVSILEANDAKIDYFKKHPLTIKGQLSGQVSFNGQLFHDPSEFLKQKPDVILICTKSNITMDLLKVLKAFGSKEDTVFVSCQNGIDVEDIVSLVFGPEHSLRMILNFGCNFVAASEVYVSFCFEHFISAGPEFYPQDHRIVEDLNKSGLQVKLATNYKEEAFKKAILNSALGPICALTRMTMSQVMEEPELLRMVKQLVRESIMIGTQLGFKLDHFFDQAMSYLSSGGNHKPSMLVDIEHFRVTENEFLCGKLFRYAEDFHIEVPVIQTVYYLVKNLEKTLRLNNYISEQKV